MSPGDAFHPEPYAYVAPNDMRRFCGEGWNAPFGAFLGHHEIRTSPAPLDTVLRFLDRCLSLVASAEDALCE
jgi:hypothetical protein